jgi:ATP-binding cassette subfamily F protein 3
MALMDYDGAMIVVSHDRDFLFDLTSRTVEFRDKQIFNHLGDVKEFLEKFKYSDIRDVSLGKDKEAAAKVKANAPAAIDPETEKKIKKLQRDVQQSEKKIEGFEKEKTELELKLSSLEYGTPEFSKINTEYDRVKSALGKEMEIWEGALTELDELGV